MRFSSRFARSVLAAALLACTVGLTAPQAQADSRISLGTCAQGSAVQEIDPGLTFETKQQHVNEEAIMVGCLFPSMPDVVAVTIDLFGSGLISCLAGSTEGSVIFTYYTEDDQQKGHSVGTYETTVPAPRPGGQQDAVVTGEIKSGDFAGGIFAWNETLFTSQFPDCATDGVQAQAGIISGFTLLG